MKKIDKDKFLYIRTNVLKSGLDSNGNCYSEYTLRKMAKNYNNLSAKLSHEKIGKVIDARFSNKTKSIELVVQIDKKKYPDIAKQIESGKLDTLKIGFNNI